MFEIVLDCLPRSLALFRVLVYYCSDNVKYVLVFVIWHEVQCCVTHVLKKKKKSNVTINH